MDSIYSDRKFSELGDTDLGTFLDNDVFDTTEAVNGLGQYGLDIDEDNDWLNSFFEDPVLNDKMITEAAHPPRIQSEHSYSQNYEQAPASPLGLTKIEDMDSDFFPTSTCSPMDLTSKTTITTQQSLIKQEPASPTADRTHTCYTVKQPTIILATTTTQMVQQRKQDQTATYTLPKVNIKVEPPDSLDVDSSSECGYLPPTPPSSASSDSEGGQSPQRSAPSSPIRQIQPARSSMKTSMQSPFIQNTIPQSGILILTEEEKRTLITEGYPIPNKLPLTKQEEKNLKKIRRKIKNKISAQESRRKKKEYLECLEKRLEQFNSENNDLKKKVDSLESNNKSLLSQLQKLQAIVNKVRPSSPTTTTGTCLMVLGLCFAVFLGSWSPTTLNVGYTSMLSNPSNEFHRAAQHSFGPQPKDAYSTNSRFSRVLLAVREEHEDSTFYDPYSAFSSADKLIPPDENQEFSITKENALVVEAPLPSALENNTADDTGYQASMHPDITANITANFIENSVNATA